MFWLIPVLTALGSAAIGASGAHKAATTQARAQKQAGQIATDTFDKQAALNEPFRAAGVAGVNALAQGLGVGGDPNAANYGALNKPFSATDFATDPGYGFRLSEGQKALEHSAAARGGLLSGATLKGTERFAQGLASDEYMNAFTRYQTERNARIGALQSLSGVGQSATNSMTNAAGAYGTNQSEAATGAGAARASGYVGATNAVTNGIGQVADYYAQKPLNDMLTSYYARQNQTSYAPYDPFTAGGAYGR